MLVAGDTFRAAAVEQLQIWGGRTGAPVVSGAHEADAAGLAFNALTQARADGADVLLIDTAGRLHNKGALMGELQKVIRVLRKQDPAAPTPCCSCSTRRRGTTPWSRCACSRRWWT